MIASTAIDDLKQLHLRRVIVPALIFMCKVRMPAPCRSSCRTIEGFPVLCNSSRGIDMSSNHHQSRVGYGNAKRVGATGQAYRQIGT